jgi:hypothetical protein
MTPSSASPPRQCQRGRLDAYGDITTNGIESAFSLFKRSVIGSFHKISIKHLHRYLSEFETRFNARKADDRFNPTLRRMLGVEPMSYAELTAEG